MDTGSLTDQELYRKLMMAQIAAGNTGAGEKNADYMMATGNSIANGGQAGGGMAGALAQGIRGGTGGYMMGSGIKQRKDLGDKQAKMFSDVVYEANPPALPPAGNNPDEMGATSAPGSRYPLLASMQGASNAPTADMASFGQQAAMSPEALKAEQLRKYLAQLQGGM